VDFSFPWLAEGIVNVSHVIEFKILGTMRVSKHMKVPWPVAVLAQSVHHGSDLSLQQLRSGDEGELCRDASTSMVQPPVVVKRFGGDILPVWQTLLIGQEMRHGHDPCLLDVMSRLTHRPFKVGTKVSNDNLILSFPELTQARGYLSQDTVVGVGKGPSASHKVDPWPLGKVLHQVVTFWNGQRPVVPRVQRDDPQGIRSFLVVVVVAAAATHHDASRPHADVTTSSVDAFEFVDRRGATIVGGLELGRGQPRLVVAGHEEDGGTRLRQQQPEGFLHAFRVVGDISGDHDQVAVREIAPTGAIGEPCEVVDVIRVPVRQTEDTVDVWEKRNDGRVVSKVLVKRGFVGTCGQHGGNMSDRLLSW
jgi:hypothetical protein